MFQVVTHANAQLAFPVIYFWLFLTYRCIICLKTINLNLLTKGKNCEQQDVCGVRNPCMCGTCASDLTNPFGFRCQCPPGYSGQRCERALNCLDLGFECKNGGQCVPRVLGDYVCSCPQPYCGVTCTNIVPQCKRFIY